MLSFSPTFLSGALAYSATRTFYTYCRARMDVLSSLMLNLSSRRKRMEQLFIDRHEWAGKGFAVSMIGLCLVLWACSALLPNSRLKDEIDDFLDERGRWRRIGS
jgi:hypothetical protein